MVSRTVVAEHLTICKIFLFTTPLVRQGSAIVHVIDGNLGTDKLNDLPTVTQEVCERTGNELRFSNS